MNQVILVGNLGKDPNPIGTATGTAMVSFTLATHERYKKGDQWEERTEWHSVVAFGKLAETVLQHLKKGAKVLVQGRLSSRTKELESGEKQYRVEVKADEITFL